MFLFSMCRAEYDEPTVVTNMRYTSRFSVGSLRHGDRCQERCFSRMKIWWNIPLSEKTPILNKRKYIRTSESDANWSECFSSTELGEIPFMTALASQIIHILPDFWGITTAPSAWRIPALATYTYTLLWHDGCSLPVDGFQSIRFSRHSNRRKVML